LQCAAMRCNALQTRKRVHIEVCKYAYRRSQSISHNVTVCCVILHLSPEDAGSVLQCVAVCCTMLQCVAVCCGVLQCVAVVVCCTWLQCVAVCCGVLQCVAVCCSMFLTELCSTAANCSRTLFKTRLSVTNSFVYAAAARRSAHELSHD